MLTATLWELFLAALAFTGGHFLLSSPQVRSRLVARLGAGPFLGLYSLLMLAAFAWLIASYARAPREQLWIAPGSAYWLPIILMPFAFILLVGSLSQRNPTAVGADPGRQPTRPGMVAVTRHPMLWGFALWAGSHLVVNGDIASAIFFGSFLLLAVGGTLAIDDKLRRRDPAGWQSLKQRSSNLPLGAMLTGRARPEPTALAAPIIGGLILFVVVLLLHPWLFGVNPTP